MNRLLCELFTIEGRRKYLTAEEQERFIAAANAHERAEVRTFRLTLTCTGCRISEALELPPSESIYPTSPSPAERSNNVTR